MTTPDDHDPADGDTRILADHPDTSDTADHGWGPVMAAGGRRRRWPRRLVMVLVVLLAVPLLWGWALGTHALGSMQREAVPSLSAGGSGRMNVLLTGSDSRADLTAEERQDLATGQAAGERTDVIMVLSVTNNSAELLAFPRDLWVTRCDGSVGRINAALSLGGTTCLVDTVEELSGIPVHHAMAIDFGGFRDLVDAVGGVRMCTDKDLVDPKAGLDLQAGCHHMDGRTALGFVRTRQLDSDLQRIERQQQFLGALVTTVMTPENLLVPWRAWEVAGAGGSVITADQDLGMLDMLRLGRGARALAGAVEPQIVPATPDNRNGAAVLIPDLAAAEELFAPLRTGRAPDDRNDADPTSAVTPSQVRVAVLNGTDIAGLAGRTADRLAAEGFDVTVVANGPPTARTQLAHASGGAAAAAAVDAALADGAVTTEAATVGDLALPEDVDVVVMAGPELDE